MSSQRQQQHQMDSRPIWLVRWRAQRGGKGRKHVAVFIPRKAHSHVDPRNGVACIGTCYQVKGAPMAGFATEIRRNWDTLGDTDLEWALEIGSILEQNVWEPPNEKLILDDNYNHCEVDRCALLTQPPSVTKRLWVAEEVMDCQDWVLSFLQRLVQRRLLAQEAYITGCREQEPKVALMRDPEGDSRVDARKSASSESAQLITNSIIPAFNIVQQWRKSREPEPAAPTATSIASSTTAGYSQSQWVTQRRRFERFNNAAQRWEWLDTQTQKWIASK